MKNLLKFFACSAVLLFVAACQKDDEITTFSKQQEEAKMTTISFEEFKQNVNAYNELDRVARHKLEKIRVNDPNGFYYDTKDIVLITYKDLKTYTIPVYGGRERQKTFRNLVIQDKAGRNPHSFLLHYTLTNDDLIKLAENKPIPNLPEKTVLTAPDGGDEEYIFRASDGNCYYYAASFTPNPANSVQIFIEGLGVITAERVECPPDLGFTENDNGGGGDGGDGGDNGGGGIDNGMPINIYIPYPATPDTGPITNPAWPIGGGSPNIPDTPIITVPTTNLLFQRFKNQLDGVSYLWLLDEAGQEIRDMIEDLLGNTGGDAYLEREEVANKLVEFMQDEDNEDEVELLLDYLAEKDYDDDSVDLVNWAIDFFEDNSDITIEEFTNWFLEDPEFTDGEPEIDPDDITYETPIVQQNLPSLSDFFTNFPKKTSGGYYLQMPTAEVYTLVGGTLLSSYNADPIGYGNACSIRGSRGLLYSGITIPVLVYTTQRTQKGGDNLNYILDAVSYGKFMTDKFGAATHELSGPDANDPQKVADFLKGKNGIYVIINNNPGSVASGGAGYSGHVDVMINGKCLGGAYTQPKGGVKSIRIWELN